VNDWFIRRRSSGTTLFGVSVPRPIGEHMYFIQVGQDLAHRDVIIDDVVASFFPRVAWITFPILLMLLLIDILIFRRALDPVREASTTASAIGPQRTEVRLPEQSMPAEIVPLVHAVNQALDRLEAGFRVQRDFTADMAHELRTPLAIVRARVDSLEPGPIRDALRADLVNMTRTVNQVLDIAELENFIVATDARADLHEVCSDAVGFMAPLAVELGKTISLTGEPGPVWVRGHAEALFRAVRNLIENALRHTPAGLSIEVEMLKDGVRVLDDGPGVPEADRETIFRRFWRRDRTSGDSRGLGLAIVARVAEAHDGSVTVENRPEGGAVFTLRLRPVSGLTAAN
jgi:signal transduction histidine kinase